MSINRRGDVRVHVTKGDACATLLRRLAFILDTSGWILYRQGKFAEAEPYLRSAFAISPRSETGMHLAMNLAKSGRSEEALKQFDAVRGLADFTSIDTREGMRAMAEIAGGEAQLDSRAEKLTIGAVVRVVVFVDPAGSGKNGRGGRSAGSGIVSRAGQVAEARPDRLAGTFASFDSNGRISSLRRTMVSGSILRRQTQQTKLVSRTALFLGSF